MTKLLISISLIFCFISFSQENQLIDHPIKHLGNNCFGYNVDLGIDSVNGYRSRAEILYVDYEDNCVPALYNVFMYQFNPIKYYYLVIIQCSDSSFSTGFSKSPIPEHCQYWVKTDSNSTRQYAYSKPGTLGQETADSVLFTDLNCLNDFYQIESDSVKCDSIFKKNKTYFDSDYIHNYRGVPYWKCTYYYSQKHGEETAYYSIDEVSGKCVNANMNLKKYEGQWKYGEKNGKWYFYNVYGELIRIEYYRKGICKKTKQISAS